MEEVHLLSLCEHVGEKVRLAYPYGRLQLTMDDPG